MIPDNFLKDATTRQRFLWHFLVMAAKKPLRLDERFVTEVFELKEGDLKIILDTCEKLGFPKLTNLLDASDKMVIHFDSATLLKMTHGVLEIPEITNKNDNFILLFLSAKYFAYSIPLIQDKQSLFAAFDFWQNLNFEKISHNIKNILFEYLENINKFYFDFDIISDNDINAHQSIANTMWKNFQGFTSSHAFLIIHNNEFSQKIDEFEKIKNYYREEKDKIESKKFESESFFESSKNELSEKIKEMLDDAQKQANDIIQNAKNRYPEMLLKGFADTFNRQASEHHSIADKWFYGMIASFVTTIFVVFSFVGYFEFDFGNLSMSSKSFLIAVDEKVNWAAMLSGVAPRAIVLALAAAVTLFCARMYRIQKHLEAANRYRANAIAAFEGFMEMLRNEKVSNEKADNGINTRKDVLFDQLARLIYEPIQTGYTDDQKLKTSELANMLATAMRNHKGD